MSMPNKMGHVFTPQQKADVIAALKTATGLLNSFMDENPERSIFEKFPGSKYGEKDYRYACKFYQMGSFSRHYHRK